MSNPEYIRYRWVIALCILILGLATGQGLAEESRTLIFSTYATERPSEELRKMEPFRGAVEEGLRKHGQALRVEVRIFPSYEEGVNAIVGGEVDFSRLGPVNYILSKQRNPGLILLAVEAHSGSKKFSGLIIVEKNSPIHSLADLRGKKFAFGDPSSTTGRYLAQAVLANSGITARDLGSYAYLGRHDKVVFAVASGAYDAGATNERTFDKYVEQLGLRDLVHFPSPTQAWVARDRLDSKITEALRATLLSLQGPALDYIDRNGFLPGNDSDYDELRTVMKDAHRFGD